MASPNYIFQNNRCDYSPEFVPTGAMNPTQFYPAMAVHGITPTEQHHKLMNNSNFGHDF
jgi:hypothetical protein